MRKLMAIVVLLCGAASADAAETCKFGNSVFVDGAGSELRFSGENVSFYDAYMTVGDIKLTGNVSWNNGAARPWLSFDSAMDTGEEAFYTAQLYVLQESDGQVEIDFPPPPNEPTVPTLLLPSFSYYFYQAFRDGPRLTNGWPGDIFHFARCEPVKSVQTAASTDAAEPQPQATLEASLQTETIEPYCSKTEKIVLYVDKGMMGFYTRNAQQNFRYVDDAKFGPFGETYRPTVGGPDEAIYRAESLFAAASPKSSKLVIFRDRVFWPCDGR